MYNNLQWIDEANTGILAERIEGGAARLIEPTNPDLWVLANTGTFGPIADYVAPPPDPITAAQVRAEGARRLNLIGSSYSPQERETWHVQLAEASAYQADNTAATPMLTAMTTASGEAMADLVARILSNDAAFRTASGMILGSQTELLAMDPIPQDFTNESYWTGV